MVLACFIVFMLSAIVLFFLEHFILSIVVAVVGSLVSFGAYLHYEQEKRNARMQGATTRAEEETGQETQENELLPQPESTPSLLDATGAILNLLRACMGLVFWIFITLIGVVMLVALFRS